jgi:hypothetical protein
MVKNTNALLFKILNKEPKYSMLSIVALGQISDAFECLVWGMLIQV